VTVTRAQRAGLEVVRVDNGESAFEVCPARGALVTSWSTHGQERLFLDPATFADPSKNVRGGIPVLFPIAGPALHEGASLKQHGFARTSPWAVAASAPDVVELRLISSAATRAHFPHEFELVYRLGLDGPALRLEWSVRNTGTTPMPLQLGLHPYFQVPLGDKATATVDVAHTRGWNNRSLGFEQIAASPAFDGPELDLHLLDVREHGTVLRTAHSTLELTWSESFRTLVMWTLPGQPFICVEPWSRPTALARAVDEPLPLLAPRAIESFWLALR